MEGVAAGIIGLAILGAAAARDYDRPRYYSRYDDGRVLPWPEGVLLVWAPVL